MKCPYCNDSFPQTYYDSWHVPCPSPAGDVPKHKAVRPNVYGPRVSLNPRLLPAAKEKKHV